ncbi:adrenodoxin, mitochondrial [Caerostris extrusa]|uniref:Adrenodoxin, mitochondrial n=1 Tax=Caerostris extrusa TaxID=172846 RepID=A0AAV4NM23_CAEEX|nr:adrenodoxin, mitochondrial [Caerostris extrusa]
MGMNSIIDSRYKSLLIRTNLNIELKTSPARYYSKENSRWATIIFEKPDGTQIKRKGKVGDKIQEVVGINDPDFCGYGACDGTLSCSTCHVILSNEDIKKYGEADGEEADLLDYAPSATNK